MAGRYFLGAGCCVFGLARLSGSFSSAVDGSRAAAGQFLRIEAFDLFGGSAGARRGGYGCSAGFFGRPPGKTAERELHLFGCVLGRIGFVGSLFRGFGHDLGEFAEVVGLGGHDGSRLSGLRMGGVCEILCLIGSRRCRGGRICGLLGGGSGGLDAGASCFGLDVGLFG